MCKCPLMSRNGVTEEDIAQYTGRKAYFCIVTADCRMQKSHQIVQRQ
jgi:hypothetical protein